MVLAFQRDVLGEIMSDDGLLVLATGLGTQRVLMHLIRAYAREDLVLVLNTTETEEHDLIEELSNLEGADDNLEPVRPVILNADMPSSRREALYSKNGCLFVRTRVLTMDLLAKRVPDDAVGGLVVASAHQCLPESPLAFIIQLFRESNKTAFIKAITDNPHALTRTFRGMEKTTKALYLDKAFLWPRFQASVAASLEKVKPEVIEVNVLLSGPMQAIQESVASAISSCLTELSNSSIAGVDFSDLCVRDSLHRSFDFIVRQKLDPVWDKVSRKSRQLVSDLATLRKLVTNLVTHDSVSFHAMLEQMLSELEDTSPLLLMDATQKIVRLSKRRLYTMKHKKPAAPAAGATLKPAATVVEPLQTNAEEIITARDGRRVGPEPVPAPQLLEQHHGPTLAAAAEPEPPPDPDRVFTKNGHTLTVVAEAGPKFAELCEVMNEIKGLRSEHNRHSPVLVLGRDDATCAFLKDMLTNSDLVADKLAEYVQRKTTGVRPGEAGAPSPFFSLCVLSAPGAV